MFVIKLKLDESDVKAISQTFIDLHKYKVGHHSFRNHKDTIVIIVDTEQRKGDLRLAEAFFQMNYLQVGLVCPICAKEGINICGHLTFVPAYGKAVSTMFCNHCNKDVSVLIEKVKMHHKVTCLICNKYIKMASKKEVAEIEAAELMARTEKPVNDEITFTIKTTAPLTHMPEVLSKIKESIEHGYTSGHGSVTFDGVDYPYEFDYK